MTEIVSELRRVAELLWPHHIAVENEHLITAQCARVMKAAADEIERLRLSAIVRAR